MGRAAAGRGSQLFNSSARRGCTGAVGIGGKAAGGPLVSLGTRRRPTAEPQRFHHREPPRGQQSSSQEIPPCVAPPPRPLWAAGHPAPLGVLALVVKSHEAHPRPCRLSPESSSLARSRPFGAPAGSRHRSHWPHKSHGERGPAQAILGPRAYAIGREARKYRVIRAFRDRRPRYVAAIAAGTCRAPGSGSQAAAAAPPTLGPWSSASRMLAWTISRTWMSST
jgi:hypothetical protein